MIENESRRHLKELVTLVDVMQKVKFKTTLGRLISGFILFFGAAHSMAAVWQWSAADGDARVYLWIPPDCQLMGWDVSRGIIAAIEGRVRCITDREFVLLGQVFRVPLENLLPCKPERPLPTTDSWLRLATGGTDPQVQVTAPSELPEKP